MELPPATTATAPKTSLSPTRLEGPETTQPTSHAASSAPLSYAPTPQINFRHSHWAINRARVAAGLAAAGLPESRQSAFSHCGSGAWVWVRPGDKPEYRVTSDHCHDRWCQPCATARSRTIANNLSRALGNQQCRLLTLTVRSVGEPLTELLDLLYDSFRRLRRRPLWRQAVLGSIAFCELTLGKDGNRWHPHLHVILTGSYLPQAELSAAWREITVNSHIVDIRPIHSNETTVRYVAKYASKPLCPTLARNHDRLTEAILALQGRRLCLTTGCWRGLKLTDTDADSDLEADGWLPLMSLTDLYTRAHCGDSAAQTLVNLLERSRPCPSSGSRPP